MSERIIVLPDGTKLTIIYEDLETQEFQFYSEAEAIRAAVICERLGLFVEAMDLDGKFKAAYQKLLDEVMIEMNCNALVIQ